VAIQISELFGEYGSLAAEVVFGSIDGIFSVLGIIAAAGAAGISNIQILVTGLGGAAAGALSVFAATYFSETTEKKTRLMSAWEKSKKVMARKARNGESPSKEPTKKDHAKFHELLSLVHRRALISGLVTSATSSLASLVLLLPFIVLSQFYSSNTAIITGIFLLALMGAFRGMTLKQSAAKSAIKMVVLGVIIIIASRALGLYVLSLLG
jgi:predicted membrane protein (TIGR00267 family)